MVYYYYNGIVTAHGYKSMKYKPPIKLITRGILYIFLDNDSDIFKRFQFLIKLCFSMTINKARIRTVT